jgi:glycosyltransferase involved in cell wall biosynthesis
MREFVESGRTGLHFKSGDAANLAEKVAWAWLHTEEAASMGRQARLEYEAKYTAGKSYQMLIAIYRELVQRRVGHVAEAPDRLAIGPHFLENPQ